ncbi:MAG: TonB-dependent receptor [Saprospiraceae bacterium]|nr:TonB-dependent receptor [Saprospiraceae bacterium]MCF8251682.1 TonB-dependent receptor [Saprospiraceae bacterium]MCF8282027.1 TonB-dependent receptor [Bacteroidales bacterium]MCF8311253.1 TonB-dependent receptor [Saprospiraceae bacterium]MCF8442045.1 TonB-dependent receptor [Saprospiraceae bacterium]
MARLFTLVICIFSFAIIGTAQITGTVTDASGEPLIGATIALKGTADGTITELDGTYSINAREGMLVFSFTGYESQEVPIEGKTQIDVVLQTANYNLSEIVVVGYGTQKKADLTTAVVVIDEASIKNRPMASAAEALQGKAAGVQVVQPSGKPGGDIAVRVRGATSVLAGNEPLYVVDGVPTTDIRGLNPSDIASMSVLKDASSAAIYGARAANGVVIITTKRGKEGKNTVTFNAYGGFSNLRKTVETLTTKDYRDLINEIAPGAYDQSKTGYTNWSDEVFGIGKVQSYQLAFSGGTEKTQYLFSTNYLNQEGIVAPAQFDRYSMRLNLDNTVNRWLKVGTSVNVLRSITEDTPDNASSGRGGVIMSALNTPPFLKIYKDETESQYDPNPFQPSWENPIAYMFGADQKSIDTRIFGNANLEATVFKGFSLKTNFGVDMNAHQWDYYLDPFKTNFGRNQNGLGQADKSNSNIWLWENTANYSTTFGESKVSLLAGSSIQKSRWSNSYISGNDFPADVNVTTLNAANSISASTDVQEWALESFFGRLTYDYRSKYLLTATVRRDGSSKLAHHWGTMPSVSVGWRISAEPFMQNFTAIYDLKLRAGWGKNGNQEGIPNYARYGLVNYYRTASTNPLSGPASYQSTYGNPDLRWETTAQSNVGLDLSLWKGRVNFTADAYLKKTEDVLLNVQLSNSLPITSIQTNAGKIENRGLEFNLSTVNTAQGSPLTWSTDFNISFNKNKVLELNYTDVYYFGRIYSNNQDVAIVREGLPLGVFFGYISEGVNPETGDLDYKDVNANGIFDPGDRTIIGDANPDFTYGLTNNFSWKNFDLNIFFQGSQGNDIYNATRVDLEGMFDSKNQSTAVLRRWTPDNRDTDIPRAIGGGKVDNVRNSTRFVEDGSYLRLKAITLAYNINPKSLERLKIQRLSVYVTGQNLLTITNYSGFDPEVNAFGRSATELGIDYGTYPQARTLTAGVNVEF